MITYTFEDGTTIRIDPLVVSQRIKSMLEERHMSLQELADLTGVSKSSLQRYSSGMTDKIPMDRIVQIALKTHTSLFYLLGQTDVMDEEPASGGLTITAPPKPDFIVSSGKTSVLFEMSNKMSDEQLKRLISYGEFLLSQEE